MEYSIKQPKQLIATIKDMDIKLGIVTGYAASFGTLDSDNDIIMPGAFTKTLRDQGPGSSQPRIKHLLNHNTDQPIALPQVLKEDNQGLYYESKAGTHNLGLDFLKMVDSGLITEHSIGFSTLKKTVLNPNDDWHDQKTELLELKLWEFSSLTAWGANQYTPLLGVKAAQNAEQRIEKLIKAISNGTFTDTTFTFLNEELLYLQKAFKDISTKPEPRATILPETMKGFSDTVNQFKQSLNLS
jgi:hypothetical protein